MKLIGFAGYARSGKSTAADLLLGHGFQTMHFADPIREFLLRLNPIVDYSHYVRVSDVIEEFGWDRYKESDYEAEMRGLMQRLGTECGRELLGDTVWIDAAFKRLEFSGSYAFADVRFPNEAEQIKLHRGRVIRIDRPGVGPANSHVSETSLDDWPFDARILNEGSEQDLLAKLFNVL